MSALKSEKLIRMNMIKSSEVENFDAYEVDNSDIAAMFDDLNNVDTFEHVDANNVTDEQVREFTAKTHARFDERVAFEVANNAQDNIFKVLASARRVLANDVASRIALENEIDFSFINRAIVANKRFNAKALLKVANVLHFISARKNSVDAYQNATLRSLIAFDAANKAFTHEHALCCISDKVTLRDLSVRSLLTRHNVSASTASTQASQCMNVAIVLRIAQCDNDSQIERNRVYSLCDNDIVAKLKARFIEVDALS